MNKILTISIGIFFLACSDSSSTKEPIKKIVKNEVPKHEIVQKEIKKETPLAIQEVTKKVTGQDVFKKCIACHGHNAEKKALGHSQVIKGWASTKVLNALKGYKEGTYGGAMKGVMKGQLSVLTEKEMSLVAEYISKL